ncbi:hypothetical protein QKU48_gp0544 [Fadolivirus algeromassiliense]|jgi:hypothetical protein|uniref:Uncharacterized protein n=1 Tax=Fadolivirus FV1/VV64 TaxID=3070911 RepID=A0A7D3R0U8_9VIRU|nr:hypothetical protein QKU48_gp0544 [Fadolivirus algeromassiliense]QKF94002.1 hypothetical protein Fadolivirus_1_544 [Fadolivirus FV1/VV64]
MSNHTNSDLYFKSLSLNRHVGGSFDPQLQTQDQYIRDQRQVLMDNNYNLPPINRYNFGNNGNVMNNGNNNGGNNHSYLYDSLLNKFNSSGACCGGSIQQPSVYRGKNVSNQSNEVGHETNQHRTDVYLRKDLDNYDPYMGYLFNKGLMSDGHQRRRIKSSFIDINSIYRTKKPSLITETPILLKENPIDFTNGSNTIFINHPNSGYEVNDSITIDGVVSKLSTLSTIVNENNIQIPTFVIPGGCNVMRIKYKHGVPTNYSGNTIKVKLDNIKGDRGTTETASFLGSIQTNILNNIHNLRLFVTSDEIFCPIDELRAKLPDVDPTIPNDNYFYIILPVRMQQPTNGNDPYTLSLYNFRLSFESIAGLPLNIINAKYPIDSDHLQGYHIIKSVNSRGYSIELPLKSTVSPDNFSGGGNCIYVSRITTINTGYIDPNKYKISLENVFHNIISVRLISSEIPNTQRAIKNIPTEQTNNKLYWNDIDDGDYLYQIQVPSGNYSPPDLAAKIEELFNATPRITSTEASSDIGITYTNRHIIQTNINQNTDEVTFKSFKEFILNTPIINVIPEPPPSSVINSDPNQIYQLVINHPSHGMPTAGQTIIISGAIDHFGIPASVINGEHVVTSLGDSNGNDVDNKYIITLPRFNLLTTRDQTGGGVNVTIFIPDFFRMRFDQPDTLGTVLGFRDAGESTSITQYQNIISNKDLYQFEQEQNSLGQQIQKSNNSIQLSGESYIIMVANPIKTYRTIGKIRDAFAKIILCDSPGKILYNTFVPMNYIFDDPLHELYELDIAFYNPDGSLFDFNGVDHSFTLEIVTINDIPEGTGINANTGKNYNQEIQ